MNDDTELGDIETKTPRRDVKFDGRRSELAGLLFRNLLLTLATLGIYRFWGNTRVRRFLWREVKLLDEPLEYLGTGTELFIGFLIAIVFIAPLTTVFSWLPFLVPQGVPYGGLLLQALYYGSLGFLVQLAIYRVRRYRLTRTAWRGVRFGLEGSAFKYALIWCLYGVATLATAGLAYPWMRVATVRYFANNARFGTTCFSFECRAFPLFTRWLAVMAPAVVAFLLFFLANAEELALFWDSLRHQAPDLDFLILTLEQLTLHPLGLLMFSAGLRVFYRVDEFRHLVNSARLGGQRLISRLHAYPVCELHYRFYGLAFITITFGVGGVVRLLDVGSIESEIGLVIGLLAMVFGYWFYGVCKTLFLKISLLAMVCETLSVEDRDVLGRAVQSTAARPGYGEGLADALDVGGF